MRSHIVQPGDTLASIALLYGITVEALLLANNLSSPYILYPGQALIIPVNYGPQYQTYPYPVPYQVPYPVPYLVPYPAPYPYNQYHPHYESLHHPRPRPHSHPHQHRQSQPLFYYL